ncbi:hypothetical protein N7467_010305 [Penicillium canescens]|nr:hypothetical protein N7467_010305 [Penicillium canescens]
MKPETQVKDVSAMAKPAGKTQPWKVFMSEPIVRPFPVDEATENHVLRLKVEKDQHGLGG